MERARDAVFCVILSLAGCSREEPARAASTAPTASAGGAQPSASVAAPRAIERTPRTSDPAMVALRTALEQGDLDTLRANLPLVDRAGDEAVLLRARAAAIEGHATDAMRLLEEAAAKRPADPDVYATGAEIYASRNAFDTASQWIVRGEHACGETPEILRAKGVTWISREGGVQKGLAALLAAREKDPTLPFCDRALGQAHLLSAKEAQRAQDPVKALAQVRASLASDPQDVDARLLLSECLAANGDLEGAVGELEALVSRGEKRESELALMHKRAGIAALLAKDRPRAVEHFRLARERGLDDAALGTGADVLADEARQHVERGVSAYEAQDFANAESEFRAAIALEPEDLAGRNHLAVVRFLREDYAEAARLWRGVIDTAAREKVDLPDPVHVNLSKALERSGDRAGARKVLEEYLAREPRGEWKQQTDAALARLNGK